MGLLFGAIADDLAGGLELAAMLRAEGVGCDFVSDTDALDPLTDREAIVVALRTRVAPKGEAIVRFETAAAHLLMRGARQIFFKYCATFDSTNDGNIGPCVDALVSATGARQTLFCPASPEAGRRVFQGHLFSDDQLISESPKRYDPLTPMTDPNLVRVLQAQTKAQVGLLPQQTVRAGVAAMNRRCTELRAAGKPYVIADAATPMDLEAIAELSVDWPLMTGNSSVAAHYPKLWRERGLSLAVVKADIPPVAGPGIVLAGSCAERTLKQLEIFATHRPVRFIDLHDARDHDVAQAAIDWALPLLASGPDRRSRFVAYSRIGVGEKRPVWLKPSSAGLRKAGVTRFLIAGGESSSAVLEHLQVRRLRVGA